MKIIKNSKKQEVIEVVTPEFPKNNPSIIVNPKDVYSERMKKPTYEHSISDCLDKDDKLKKIGFELTAFEKKINELLHLYFFLKLFSKAALKDVEYNEKIIMLDKYVNQLKKQYEALKKNNNALKRKNIATDDEVDELFYKVSDIFDYCSGLKKDLDEIKKKYYPNIKMVSYTLCNSKTYQELDMLNNEINEELSSYKSLQEAYDFISYNTGELITETIEALLNFIKNGLTKNYISNINMDYFIENEIIIYYDYEKWIKLMSKINYVLQKCDKSVYSDENFMIKYKELERKYLIILIYNEAMNMGNTR